MKVRYFIGVLALISHIDTAAAAAVSESQITRNVRAYEFVNAIGVNIHGAQLKNGYRNSALILKSLNYLGVTDVREALPYDGQARALVDAVADAGVRFCFVPSRALPEQGLTGMSKFISSLRRFERRNPYSIYGVEGLNEANAFSFSYNGDGSLRGAVGFQRYLYQKIKADSMLRDIKVINLSLAYQNQDEFESLGDLSNYSDASNSHIYTKPASTSDKQIRASLDLARIPSPGNPIIVSEIGHPTLTGEEGIGTSTTVQAKLTLSELFSAWENGARRMYLYELFDNSTAGVERGLKEAHFGLFYADGSPKLAATALRNMLAILSYGDRGGVDGRLAYKFSIETPPNNVANVHAMGLEKSGGVYNIVVWPDVRLRDGSLKDLVYPEVSTIVKFGHLAKKVRVYDPVKSLVPIATATNTSGITLPLKDRPLIVEVDAVNRVQIVNPSSASQASMTAGEFVAQIDKLSRTSGLRTITLRDGRSLPVPSVETMKYVISAYGAILSKISGGYSFEVGYENSTLRKISFYDARGNFKQLTEQTLEDGEVVRTKVTGAGGTVIFLDER